MSTQNEVAATAAAATAIANKDGWRTWVISTLTGAVFAVMAGAGSMLTSLHGKVAVLESRDQDRVEWQRAADRKMDTILRLLSEQRSK